MRTIKFRGQRIDKPSEWWEGSLISLENGKCYITQDLLTPEQRNEKVGHCLTHFSEVIPKTVGQFIGEIDKNGKEIYEGDILARKYGGKWVVEFDEGSFVYRCIESTMAIGWEVVIGNVHDNQNLLV